ncbi:MAG TPA: glucose-1-phosphate cytidylyltransferase [Coriobacteriia bacterium]
MKVVILAGGLGTRISEETATRPKPMAEIGDKPVLWHIMKTYSHYGFNDFVICAGYKSYMIKEYFHNYWLHNCDVTFDMRTHESEVHQDGNEPWRVTVVDTGAETMTGGRVKRIQPYVGAESFLLTYGDGVGDVDIAALVEFHQESGREVTLTAVQPAGRFGALEISGTGSVERFTEKPLGDGDWINGGFFVMEPSIFDRIAGDSTILEREPLESLTSEGKLGAYKHRGFWQPMDTLRDKRNLEELWDSGTAPWKVW